MGLQSAKLATGSGKRLMHLGDIDGAIAQFRFATASDPTYAPAHFELALALERQGRRSEADMEYRVASQLDPQIQQPR